MSRAVCVRAGVSIIECLLYIALAAMLIMMTVSWLAHAHARLVANAAQNACIIALCAAQDLLTRDLRFAPSAVNAWKESGPSAYIWHTASSDIGWELRDKQLCRIEGSYDAATQKWGKHHTSVIADALVVFDIQLHKEKGDKAARWTSARILLQGEPTYKEALHEMGGKGHDVDRTIFFRQGRCV